MEILVLLAYPVIALWLVRWARSSLTRNADELLEEAADDEAAALVREQLARLEAVRASMAASPIPNGCVDEDDCSDRGESRES